MSEYALEARIVIAFQSFWAAGTGEGVGRLSDTRCHRDYRGLPALPMSQVKGTLRETAEQLAEAQVPEITSEKVKRLFGGRTKPDDEGEPDQAALSLEGYDAVIVGDVAAHLAGHGDALFQRLASTALDERGTALDRSLRTIEVAVPVVLIGRVRWRAPEGPDFDWIACLDQICASTPAFGKGKRDGYGRALAWAEPVPPTQAKTPAPGTGIEDTGEAANEEFEIPAGAFVLDLTLVPQRNAVFSGRSATEGAHATLLAPTGAALLGWCAQTAGYETMTDPLAVYHSGAVSFSDARPVGPYEQDEVIPVPASLTVPKGREKDAKTEAGILDLALVRNGRPPDPEDDEQYEALKDRLMTARYAVIKPQTGQRLRTATHGGRAATGQLFGLQHIVGGPQNCGLPSAFTARIAIGAGIDRADAKRIVEAFDGQTLTIGKGRNTGYGGAFACTARILEVEDEFLDPEFSGLLRVLALSDIAAVNAFGAPAPIIDPADLGLPGAIFNPQASVLRHRSFAPWNGTLKCRDTERHVIEAGSVLAYTVPQPDQSGQVPRRQRVGAWQEMGLGAVWLDPSFLRDWKLPPAARDDTAALAEHNPAQDARPADLPEIDPAIRPEERALIEWAMVRTYTAKALAKAMTAPSTEV